MIFGSALEDGADESVATGLVKMVFSPTIRG
jgi:hypothetical protein